MGLDPSILHNERIARLISTGIREKEGIKTLSEAVAVADDKAEAVLQGEIASYLRLHEIEFIRPDMRKKSPLPVGWPDFTLAYRPSNAGARDAVPIALECKTPIGKLSSDQTLMHMKLAKNGWRVLVVRSVADVQKLFREIDSELNPPAAVLAHFRNL